MIKELSCPRPAAAVDFVERRSGKDRRQTRFSFLLRPFTAGRRRNLRREEDRRRIFLLDYYSPKILYVVILILALSVTDALLTLWLISDGARELNPVMAFFLEFGPNVFMAAKYLFTSISVMIIVLLNYVLIQRVKFRLGYMLNFFAAGFAAVVAWEIVLMARHVF